MSTISFGRTALGVLFLSVAACGGTPTGGANQGGQFTADLSGVVTTRLTGTAGSQGRVGVTWTLLLVHTDAESSISVFIDGDGRPAPGTYPLVDFTTHNTSPVPGVLVGAVVLGNGVLPGPGFDILSGTFTVTSSTPTSVVGTFLMTAAHSSSPGTVLQVSGTFDALNQDT